MVQDTARDIETFRLTADSMKATEFRPNFRRIVDRRSNGALNQRISVVVERQRGLSRMTALCDGPRQWLACFDEREGHRQSSYLSIWQAAPSVWRTPAINSEAKSDSDAVM